MFLFVVKLKPVLKESLRLYKKNFLPLCLALLVEAVLRAIGVPVEPFHQVLAEGKYADLLLEEKRWCQETLGVTNIPSYFIHGKKLTGVMDPAQLERAILDAEGEQETVTGMACGEDGCGPAPEMVCGENGCGPVVK